MERHHDGSEELKENLKWERIKKRLGVALALTLIGAYAFVWDLNDIALPRSFPEGLRPGALFVFGGVASGMWGYLMGAPLADWVREKSLHRD